MKRALLPQFQSQVRGTEPNAAVLVDPGRSHQRKHQGAIGNIASRQPDVEQSNAVIAIAPVHPVLRGKLMLLGPLDGCKRNFIEAAAGLNGGWKEKAVTHERIVVDDLALEVDALDSFVNARPG